jgi:hypothetical protein
VVEALIPPEAHLKVRLFFYQGCWVRELPMIQLELKSLEVMKGWAVARLT